MKFVMVSGKSLSALSDPLDNLKCSPSPKKSTLHQRKKHAGESDLDI